MATKKVIINGIEYPSLENAPQMVKDMFADKDGNGVPDIFEGKAGNFNLSDIAKQVGSAVQTMQNFVVNGQSYSQIEQIPEPYRSQVKDKMKAVSGMFAGVPNTTPAGWTQAPTSPTSPANVWSQDPMASRSGGISVGKFIMAAIAVFFVIACIAAVVFFAVLPEK